MLADLVWEARDAGLIPDELACIAWTLVAQIGIRLASNDVQETMIIKYWRRLFPPSEVVDTKARVQEVLDKHAGICRPLVESRIAKDVAQTEFVVYSVRKRGWSPAVLAMIVTRNSLEEMIIGGQYHTYRGILSLTGDDMMKTLRSVVLELKSVGEMADVDTDDYFKLIREQIQLAG